MNTNRMPKNAPEPQTLNLSFVTKTLFLSTHISPTHRGGPFKRTLFYKKKSIPKNVRQLRFKIVVLTMEIHCNDKNLKYQFFQIALKRPTGPIQY